MIETRIPPIGAMTDRVALHRRVTTAEDEGGETATFVPIANVWARVRALTARHAFEADGRGENITHSVVVRFRTDLKPGDRVTYRGRHFDIAACEDINGRRAYLSCQCRERAVTG